MTAKEMHVAAGYFARFTTIKQIQGLILELPKNIFLNIPAEKILYELEDGKLNVYKNGSKSEVVECPNYAQRHLVATDVTIEMTLRAMGMTLSRAFDAEGVSVTSEEDKMGLIDLIIPSRDKETRRLEFVFQNALHEFMKHEDLSKIPNSVVDGFAIVTNRYLKGIK